MVEAERYADHPKNMADHPRSPPDPPKKLRGSPSKNGSDHLPDYPILPLPVWGMVQVK